MQVVILAAGQGKRLRPITHKIPKPMIRLAGRNIIERNLSILPERIDKVIIVVGYLQNNIKKFFGASWQNKKIKYVEQKNLLGTAHALFLCKKILKDRFLVIMGDNVYWWPDLSKCLRYDLAILVKKAEGQFNSIIKDKQGFFKGLKPITGRGLLNTGAYLLNEEIFKYKKVKFENGEYGLPQTLALMAKDFPIKVVYADKWLQINTLGDLRQAHSDLKVKD